VSVGRDAEVVSHITVLPVVNFTNILRVAFVLIFLRQKIAKPNCNLKKAAQNTFVQKNVD